MLGPSDYFLIFMQQHHDRHTGLWAGRRPAVASIHTLGILVGGIIKYCGLKSQLLFQCISQNTGIGGRMMAKQQDTI